MSDFENTFYVATIIPVPFKETHTQKEFLKVEILTKYYETEGNTAKKC